MFAYILFTFIVLAANQPNYNTQVLEDEIYSPVDGKVNDWGISEQRYRTTAFSDVPS